MNKLTAIQVKKLKPKEKPYTLSDGGGLTLHIAPDGKKKWLSRYSLGGKPKMITVGYYPEISLSDAREKHSKTKAMAKQGVNPTEEKRKEIPQQKEEGGQWSFKAIALEWHKKNLLRGVRSIASK